MKTSHAILSSFAVLALAGCATLQVETDYDPEVGIAPNRAARVHLSWNTRSPLQGSLLQGKNTGPYAPVPWISRFTGVDALLTEQSVRFWRLRALTYEHVLATKVASKTHQPVPKPL